MKDNDDDGWMDDSKIDDDSDDDGWMDVLSKHLSNLCFNVGSKAALMATMALLLLLLLTNDGS